MYVTNDAYLYQSTFFQIIPHFIAYMNVQTTDNSVVQLPCYSFAFCYIWLQGIPFPKNN